MKSEKRRVKNPLKKATHSTCAAFFLFYPPPSQGGMGWVCLLILLPALDLDVLLALLAEGLDEGTT